MDFMEADTEPYEGQIFESFYELKRYLKEYGNKNYVKFWIRSSHTIQSVRKASKKVNPALKYVYMKFACIYGGEKIRKRGAGLRQSATFRNIGCPCMINATVTSDGNRVKLETVVLEHNHEVSKMLYNTIQHTRKARVQKLGREASVPVEAPVGTADNVLFQNVSTNTNGCLDDIQQQYGSNVKIILINGEDEIKVEPGEIFSLPENNPSNENVEIEAEKITVCRLCLTSADNVRPIFDPNNALQSTLLALKIMACASIDVSQDDGLPDSICPSCEATLDIAYQFRMQCENSDSFLREENKEQPERHIILEDKGTTDDTDIMLGTLLGVSDGTITVDENKEEDNRSFVLEDQSTILRKDDNQLEYPTADVFSLGKDDIFDWVDTENGLTLDKALVGEGIKFEDDVMTVCPACQVTFPSSELLLHIETHAKDFNIVCHMCGVPCATIVDLTQHALEHSQLNDVNQQVQELDIDLAPTQFEDGGVNQEDSPGRRSTKRASKPRTYLCNVCGKILNSKERFKSHRNTHEGLRPYVCGECGRAFADRKNMHQHVDTVHVGKANHECPVCHKKFYAPTKMKSHMTMHYGVKPFFCDKCGKTFRLKMNLVKHLKIHLDNRPHQCPKCPASFIDKNMLKRHSYVHGGVRPFPCPKCGHRFAVKFHLKKHLEKNKCCESVSARWGPAEQQVALLEAPGEVYSVVLC